MLVRAARCRQAVRVAERVRVREIDDDEGKRLLRIVRRGSGSVVTWRRAQMVLLSAQGMPVAKIAEVTFTSADRARDVIRNFDADGFDSLYPKYSGGRPRTPERREIKKIAKSKPVEHGLPFSTWSLVKLADFLVAEGVVDDISHEGLRVLLREEGVSFQRIKTWKTSRDPDYAAKKARVEHLYAIADREVIPDDGEPDVVLCMDEFGPLNLQPHPGRQWAERGGRHKDPDREPRPRKRATYTRRTESATCSPPTTWTRTSSTGTSSRRRTGRGSWSSAATCAASTHPRSASPLCWTTSPRT
jgi:transposase